MSKKTYTLEEIKDPNFKRWLIGYGIKEGQKISPDLYKSLWEIYDAQSGMSSPSAEEPIKLRSEETYSPGEEEPIEHKQERLEERLVEDDSGIDEAQRVQEAGMYQYKLSELLSAASAAGLPGSWFEALKENPPSIDKIESLTKDLETQNLSLRKREAETGLAEAGAEQARQNVEEKRKKGSLLHKAAENIVEGMTKVSPGASAGAMKASLKGMRSMMPSPRPEAMQSYIPKPVTAAPDFGTHLRKGMDLGPGLRQGMALGSGLRQGLDLSGLREASMFRGMQPLTPGGSVLKQSLNLSKLRNAGTILGIGPSRPPSRGNLVGPTLSNIGPSGMKISSLPENVETLLTQGEQVLEAYSGPVFFWVGSKKGWEIGENTYITQMETGSHRFVGTGQISKKPRSKIIGKNLDNADAVAVKKGIM